MSHGLPFDKIGNKFFIWPRRVVSLAKMDPDKPDNVQTTWSTSALGSAHPALQWRLTTTGYAPSVADVNL